jgi:recombination protein RecT
MSTDMVRGGGKTTALVKPIDKLKGILAVPSVQEGFNRALADAAPLFTASIIDVVGSSKELQECEPGDVIKEAMKAAVLRLPINRSLGFAWIVPRKDHGSWAPQMQIGWRGFVQLAQRTAQYRYLNAGPIFEGETINEDRLTGAVTIAGKATSDVPLGFFAYFELLNGFRKAIYWSAEKMAAHRDRYVPKWEKAGGAWVTHSRDMATKTVLATLLRKWGVLSVEMQRALETEPEEQPTAMPNSEPLSMGTRITASPVQQTPPQDTGPEWLPILRERIATYKATHDGKLPEGFPRDITDSKTASVWIDKLGSDPPVEPEPPMPDADPYA